MSAPEIFVTVPANLHIIYLLSMQTSKHFRTWTGAHIFNMAKLHDVLFFSVPFTLKRIQVIWMPQYEDESTARSLSKCFIQKIVKRKQAQGTWLDIFSINSLFYSEARIHNMISHGFDTHRILINNTNTICPSESGGIKSLAIFNENIK